MAYPFRDPAQVGANHRRSRRKGFKNNQRPSLEPARWHGEKVILSQQWNDPGMGDWWPERNPAIGSNESLECVPVSFSPVALGHPIEMEFDVECRRSPHGLDQRIGAF